MHFRRFQINPFQYRSSLSRGNAVTVARSSRAQTSIRLRSRTICNKTLTTVNPTQSLQQNRLFHTVPKRSRLPTTATVLKSASFISLIGSLFSSSARAEGDMSYPDKRSDDEWRAVLSPQQFRILREKGTEVAGTGEYNKHYPSKGIYTCAGCDAPLYKASHKFDSGCGWPAYFDSVPGAVTRHVDNSFGIERTEIVCSNCGGHLGHVFKGEGFPNPIDERHCVNSVGLKFTEDESKSTSNEGEKQKEKAKA